MKWSPQKRKARATERMEKAATYLLYKAEHFSTTGRSFYDTMCLQMDLLEAARCYASAVRQLSML